MLACEDIAEPCFHGDADALHIRESHFGFEAAAWYWHFVDVVWLFLFIAVYWWGGTIGTGTPLPH